MAEVMLVLMFGAWLCGIVGWAHEEKPHEQPKLRRGLIQRGKFYPVDGVELNDFRRGRRV